MSIWQPCLWSALAPCSTSSSAFGGNNYYVSGINAYCEGGGPGWALNGCNVQMESAYQACNTEWPTQDDPNYGKRSVPDPAGNDTGCVAEGLGFFEVGDADGDRNLNLTEFLMLANAKKLGRNQISSRKWMLRFLKFDKDNDGLISREEATAKLN